MGQGAPPGRLLLCVLSLPSRMDVYTAPVLYRPDLCRLRLARSLEAAAEKAASRLREPVLVLDDRQSMKFRPSLEPGATLLLIVAYVFY